MKFLLLLILLTNCGKKPLEEVSFKFLESNCDGLESIRVVEMYVEAKCGYYGMKKTSFGHNFKNGECVEIYGACRRK